MSEVTSLERSAIMAELNFETVMEIECAWCNELIGYKDGLGVTGPTSGICPKCKDDGKSYLK